MNKKAEEIRKKIITVNPEEIEKKSFEILSEILGEDEFDPYEEPVIKRVIHTTADFEYADILKFNKQPVKSAVDSIKKGCRIVTDTSMAKAGINKKILAKYNCDVVCHIRDEDVAYNAKIKGITRSAVSMEKASLNKENKIFVIGNAPTALIKLYDLIISKKLIPSLIIGVPVGFVNVVESKELIMSLDIPYIVSKGRKGGSNISAAIVNAILYMLDNRKL